MKKGSGIFFFVVPAAIIILIVVLSLGHTEYISKTLNSEEEILNVAVNSAVNGKRRVHFKSTVEPAESIFNEAFEKAVKQNPYMAAELHHYVYSYTISGGVYKVKLKLQKPSSFRSFLTKIRVKQIAKKLDKALDSDYDKIKATHDYLIRYNKYSHIYGGAFRCLYFGQSACNGYAYSFFLIMKELGIPATCEFGGEHEWNSVYVGGHWYNIDVTWDDIGRNASYDYFLKCDKDWKGHTHGSSDAEISVIPTGRDIRANYALIPNYKLIGNCILVLCIAGLVVLFRMMCKMMNQRELKKIQKDLELEEQARRMFEEEIKRKQEAFGQEDHNLW